VEFSAYCPFCEATVTAHTILEGSELTRALETNAVVEIMHVADGDHGWNLIRQEKDNLLKKICADSRESGGSR